LGEPGGEARADGGAGGAGGQQRPDADGCDARADVGRQHEDHERDGGERVAHGERRVAKAHLQVQRREEECAAENPGVDGEQEVAGPYVGAPQ
jgi:hypothetical protein